MSVKTRQISAKLWHTAVFTMDVVECVEKVYLARFWFVLVIAKCLGGGRGFFTVRIHRLSVDTV